MTKVLHRFLLLAKAPLLFSTPLPQLITNITLATTTTSLPGLEARPPMLAHLTWANLTRRFPRMGWEHRHRGIRQAHSLLLNSNN